MIDFCLKKEQGLKALTAQLYQNSLESHLRLSPV